MIRRIAAFLALAGLVTLAALLIWQVWLHHQRSSASSDSVVSLQQTLRRA